MSQSVLNNFIWKQKPAKVKHSTMISEQFSFRIVDIESQAKALRMSWIYRISKHTGWGDKAQTYFDEIGGLYFILRCFYDVKYLPKMPKFYMDILKYAKEIFSVSKSKCILWNNSLIRIGY